MSHPEHRDPLADDRRTDFRSAARIALTYLALAAAWILLSDRVLSWITPKQFDVVDHAWFQTAKGLFFVSATAVLLGLLVSRRIRQVREFEQAARLNEDRLRRFAENMPGSVMIKDKESRLVFFSGQVPEGLPLNEMVGQKCYEAMDASTSERMRGHDRDVIRTGQSSQIVEPIPLAKGLRHYLMTRFPLSGPRGEPLIGAIALDVTERQQAEARVRDLARELEQANRLKDQFLSNLSHELRTPITAIRLWTDVLRATSPDEPETIREAVEMIHRSTAAQYRLIEDLLDVTRIIAGRLKIDPQPTDLGEVVRSTVELLGPMAMEREVQIETELPPSTMPVLADARRLQQVIWNLLTNSLKFSAPKGRVLVRVTHEDADWVVRVVDEGIGIPPDLLPRLFERFRQQDSSKTRAEGGLGIGLSIVKYLVDAHGGAVSAESEGEGRGAMFTVRLPVSDALPKQVPPATSQTPSPPPTVVQMDQELHGCRLLLVEDNADSRNGLSLLLRKSGASVIAVETAQEALAVIDSAEFDVLLSDIGLPGKDGCDLVTELRRRPGWANTPAIAVSAYALPEDRKRALASGFDDFVVKPVDPDQLIALLVRRLGGPCEPNDAPDAVPAEPARL